MEQQRLDKIIASTGKWSRREAKELARRGLVTVNGAAVYSVEKKFAPEAVEISVNGEVLSYRRVTWIMMNKPRGYLSATEDGRGKTVLDLLPRELQRQKLFPVGRLDKDTEGLLLLTDEGGLAHALLSPKRHVDKVYYTRTKGRLTEEDCQAFASGMSLPDGLQCQQVKRMLAARGKPVLYLERVQMGTLPLDRGLARGAFRFLTEEEIAGLRALV